MKRPLTGVFQIIALSLLLYGCDNDANPEPSLVITINQVSVLHGTHNWQMVSAEVDSVTTTIASHGFVYGQTSMPTIEDSEVFDRGTLEGDYFELRFEGARALEPDKDYYVRAFARIGEKIHYSDEVQFHSLRGSWRKLSSFPGPHRKFSIAFSAGGKVYIVGGVSMDLQKFNDVWCYDPVSNNWSQKGAFPLTSITNNEATHFLINDVAYIVSAAGFWQYDQQNDTWQKIGPGKNQTRMMSFSIAGIGYAGYGHFDGSLNAYDAIQNSWTPIPKTVDSVYPGDADFLKYSWSVDGKAYSGYGTNSTFAEMPVAEFYEYDPSANKWIARNSVFHYNQPRWGLAHFSVNNRIFVGMGRNTNDAVFGDLYEYDASVDDWIIVASTPSAPRVDAFSCASASKAYVGLGFQYYQGGQVDELYDFWEFTP